MVESIASRGNNEDSRAGYLTSTAIQMSHSLNYPLIPLHGKLSSDTLKGMPDEWTALQKPFPCDIHLFALRTLSEPTQYTQEGGRSTKARSEAALILERSGAECSTSEVDGCVDADEGRVGLY